MVLKISEFRSEFSRLTEGWSWEIEGFLDSRGFVHPIDTDTKVISTVFERLSSPVVRSIARNYGYEVAVANQTTYPDFTLSHLSSEHRIGLDVKTTYLRKRMKITLGGYNSFIRNNTKNILYPYDSYADHWVLGFVYVQNPVFEEYDLSNLPRRGEIGCPFSIRTIFLRHKHELSGLRAGSGNTKNIGSFSVTNPSEFATQTGPFGSFSDGKRACDYYWANYETFVSEVSSKQELIDHPKMTSFL